MASTTVPTRAFDLLQSKEFERHAKVKIHAKAQVPLKNLEYAESPIPQSGYILKAVADSFDKCFIKRFTPEDSPLGVLSILLVKYVDVRGKFTLPKDEIIYTPHRPLPPEGIPIIRQTYFDEPFKSFHRFQTHMIRADEFPDLLKILVTPWADQQNLNLKDHTPSSLLINGKVHTMFLHSIILLKTSMRKKNEMYPGHPADHCYYVTLKELPRFLNYLDNVVNTHLIHQTAQVLEVKARPVMKQFYKREILANLTVFGSFALSFLLYLIFPRFGWWNVILILMGLGAGAIMGGLYGRLFYQSRQKRREIKATGFCDLQTMSKEKIKEGLSCDFFRKTFSVEFPSKAPDHDLESPNEEDQKMEISDDTQFFTRVGVRIRIRNVAQKFGLRMNGIASKFKTGLHVTFGNLKKKKGKTGDNVNVTEPRPDPIVPIPKSTRKPKTNAEPKTKPEIPPSSFKTKKIQALFSD